MSPSHVNIVRIALLAAVATVLAFVVLAMDRERRDGRTADMTRAANVADAARAPQSASPSSSPATRVGASQRRAGAAAALVGGPAAAAPVTAAPATAAPATEADVPPVAAVPEKRGGVPCAEPYDVVDVPRDLQVRAAPGGRAIGTMPKTSKYMGERMRAWVQTTTPDGRWGKVTVPWTSQVSRAGWIPMTGLPRSTTRMLVVGDLSDRTIRVYRGCRLQLEAKSAIGASGSPSPVGRFWVTDRVAVPSSQPYFGSYAFGLSTIQPNTPAGWTGGDQMAIHGTNAPGTIGTAASAGCLRVAEATLARLRAMVGLGTPVVITR